MLASFVEFQRYNFALIWCFVFSPAKKKEELQLNSSTVVDKVLKIPPMRDWAAFFYKVYLSINFQTWKRGFQCPGKSSSIFSDYRYRPIRNWCSNMKTYCYRKCCSTVGMPSVIIMDLKMSENHVFSACVCVQVIFLWCFHHFWVKVVWLKLNSCLWRSF